MRPLSDDILSFVHERFTPGDTNRVFEVLDHPALTTPRVLRAVLYLSDGRLALLRQWVNSAAQDVREVLTRAEYEVFPGEPPLWVRSMAEPFPHTRIRQARQPGSALPAARRSATAAHHAHLVDRRFALGIVEYVVAADQLHESSVRCYRKCGNLVSIVQLPLLFVMEQISEHIEMNEVVY